MRLHTLALLLALCGLSQVALAQDTPQGNGNGTDTAPSPDPTTPSLPEADYCYYGRSDIAGNDLDCGQTDYSGTPRSYCELQGLQSAESACNANDDCQAWTFDGYRGYLKSTKGPLKYRKGYSVFVRTD